MTRGRSAGEILLRSALHGHRYADAVLGDFAELRAEGETDNCTAAASVALNREAARSAIAILISRRFPAKRAALIVAVVSVIYGCAVSAAGAAAPHLATRSIGDGTAIFWIAYLIVIAGAGAASGIAVSITAGADSLIRIALLVAIAGAVGLLHVMTGGPGEAVLRAVKVAAFIAGVGIGAWVVLARRYGSSRRA